MDPLFFLAIVIIALLLVLFVVSYVLNKRTPVPEGCEHLNITDEFCMQCGNKECKVHERLDLEKIRKELEEENQKDEVE